VTEEELKKEAQRAGMTLDQLKALIYQKAAPAPQVNLTQYAGGSVGADYQAGHMASMGMTESQMAAARRNRVQNFARYGEATPSFGAMTAQAARNNDAMQGVQGITDSAITSMTTSGLLAAKPAMVATRIGGATVSGAGKLGKIATSGRLGAPLRVAHGVGKKVDPSFTRLASTEGGKVAGEVANKTVTQALLRPSKEAGAVGSAAGAIRKSGLLPGYARILAPYSAYMGSR